MSWNAPQTTEGIIEKYTYSLTAEGKDPISKDITDVSKQSYKVNIPNLTPFTIYEVTVTTVNQPLAGVASGENGGGAGGVPATKTIQTPSSGEFRINWLYP